MFLHWLGVIVYGGPLLAFAVILPLAGRLPGLEPRMVDRLHRAFAPVAGLGMGAIILGGLVAHGLRHQGFHWVWGTPAERLIMCKYLVFLALWVDYTIIEIWKQEPMRQMDPSLGHDAETYQVARRGVIRHVVGSAILFLVVLALGVAAAGSS